MGMFLTFGSTFEKESLFRCDEDLNLILVEIIKMYGFHTHAFQFSC